MVEALNKTINPDTDREENSDIRNVEEDLRLNAVARGFEFLAYYRADGGMELILGKEAHITDPEPLCVCVCVCEFLF